MTEKRCKRCEYRMDYPGCDPSEKADRERPDFCGHCADWMRNDDRYRAHLKRGGRPYEARIGGPRGRRIG